MTYKTIIKKANRNSRKTGGMSGLIALQDLMGKDAASTAEQRQRQRRRGKGMRI